MAYSIPKGQALYKSNIEGFKGVDFTNSELDIDNARSPKAVNIMNYDGYMQTRHGWETIATIDEDENINGVWNIDVPNDCFLVHCGTKLYMVNEEFEQKTLLLSGMSNNISTGIYFRDKLVIFDGVRAVVYGKFDGINYTANFLDTMGYIPLTSIARDENGGGESYESFNMISPYAKNSFLSKEGQTVFKLDLENITSVVSVAELNGNTGEYDILPTTDYSVDLTNGKVTFNEAPSPSAILGKDNILITYSYNNSTLKEKVNKCSIATIYGYEGNGDRIFISGNSDFPNYEFWSGQTDCTYFPDTNYAKVGVEAIKGWLKLANGRLSILKKHSDTDNSIYYHSYNMFNNEEVFPLKDGVKTLGCLGIKTTCNLVNEPLFLTNLGVYAISTSNDEAYAKEKSLFINGKLMKEENLDKAFALSVDGKYYLSVNNHMYIADSRYLNYPKNAKTQQYQYEWYYWENIPARILFSWNEKLYFGTEDGRICGFNDGYDDDGIPVEAYWETPFMPLNSTIYAKSVKNITLEYNLKEETELEFGYYKDDENKNVISIESDNRRFIPKTISEKEKIKKFMFVKFYFKTKPNSNKRICFENLSIEYTIAGKYKGD